MRYSQDMNYSNEISKSMEQRERMFLNKLRRFWEILIQKETIAYIVVGTLTTCVNMTAYYLLCNIFGISNLVANAYSWVIAMLFAYFANAKYVFKPSKKKFIQELLQIGRFFTARGISFLVEEAAMYVFVDLLSVNNMLIKAIMNVVVVIINYFFSKQVVFK